jgi:hypothetical protein
VVTSHQQSQPTVVVTSHLPVVSVGSFTPNQLAQTLVKQAGGSKTVTQAVGSATGINPNRLTPQQINILKQKALMKQNANNKQLQGINSTAVSAGSATAAVSSGQKVSIAVTPSGVTLATLANSMPVTVVTQALGQQKTQVCLLLFPKKDYQKNCPKILRKTSSKKFVKKFRQRICQKKSTAVSAGSATAAVSPVKIF